MVSRLKCSWQRMLKIFSLLRGTAMQCTLVNGRTDETTRTSLFLTVSLADPLELSTSECVFECLSADFSPLFPSILQDGYKLLTMDMLHFCSSLNCIEWLSPAVCYVKTNFLTQNLIPTSIPWNCTWHTLHMILQDWKLASNIRFNESSKIIGAFQEILVGHSVSYMLQTVLSWSVKISAWIDWD